MSGLPESWVRAPLGVLLKEIVGGGTPSKSIKQNFRGAIPFMTVKDMRGRFIEDTEDHITENALAGSSSAIIPADTLIVASRMALGKIARPIVPVAINQDLKALFLHQGIDKTYVEYAWRANESTIKARGKGTTVKGIRLDDIRGLEIAIAPSAEQARIACHLDTLLTRIQACNDRLDAVPALLHRFRQAALSAAISGDLLEPCLATTAPVVSLQAVLAEPMRNGKSVRDGNGLSVLRLTSLKTTEVDLAETKAGDWSAVRDVQRFLIQDGDYLVSRGNGSRELVGRGGLVINTKDDIAFPDTMIRIRPDKSLLLPEYLKYVWVAPYVRKQIEQAARTTSGIWKVSQKDLEQVSFPLPELEIQAKIVRRIEALFDLSNRIEASWNTATAQIQRLTPLIFAKAFRGELLPQEAADEPATALLAKLKAYPLPALDQPSRRPPRAPSRQKIMKHTQKEAVKAVILKLKTEVFSFDELRTMFDGDYESLKTALFELLEEPTPVVRQIFDKNVGAMRLIRMVS